MPCTGPLEACNLSGQQGACTNVATPAPAASPRGLLLILLLLGGIAAIAVRGRRLD